MKEMYLTFNIFTNSYIYYEKKSGGILQKNRKELGNIKDSELIKKLSLLMNKKRKSILYLVSIPEEDLTKLENYFLKQKKSKIVIQIEESR